MARVIAWNDGPSGRNDEYLFLLEKSLEDLGVGKGPDGHVRDLAEKVRELQGGGASGEAVGREMNGVGSGGSGRADEEVEKVEPN